MKLLLIATLLISSNLFARAKVQDISQKEYLCNFDGVSSTKVKVFPESKASPEVPYRYQIQGKLNPDELVLIYLPGGPGGSSINDFSNQKVREKYLRRGIPESIPWILIDPRTVGCNRGDASIYPDESLTSKNLAHDVLTVIETLKLKKYILYGHSYGSQSATYIAGMALERGLPQPHAIFLSGVMGRGEPDGSFSIPNQLIKEWGLIKATLSPKIQDILSQEKPLGIEEWRWDQFITNALYDGVSLFKDGMKNYYLELLKLLDSDDPETRKPLLDVLSPSSTSPRIGVSDFSSRLYREVDCHEYSPDDGYTYFSRGHLYFDEENNPCKDEAFDRMYDSAEFDIESPIYYLAGTNDPAAPYVGARYHFENQVRARRNFVSIKGGGHATIGMILWDCKDQFWKAIFELKDLTEVLPNCAAEVDLEIR